MKKIFIALLAIVMVVCCFTLVACNNKAEDIINSYIFEQEGLIVDSDFVLPLTIGGEKAEWKSNSELVSLEKREEDWLARVTYPESGIQDVIITLTIGKVSKEYGVRVKAVDEYTFMENYVFLQNKGTIAKDFELDNQYTYKNKYTCNITWSVAEDYEDYIKIENYQKDGVNLQKAVVNRQSDPTPVVITATFEYKGNSASREYSMNVYQELLGYELVDYWYSNTGVSIDMSGYVVLIGTEYSSSYNNVTLYMVNDDYTAGYYLYRVKTTDEHAAKLKVGAHVTVTGTTNTNYNGLIETNAGGNLVVDTDKYDPYDASKAVKAVDEEVIGDLPATIYNESRLVSLSGWMVKSHCAESDLSSDNFTLMTITKGGVDVAIRMSKYLEGAYTKGDDTHKALLALLDKYIVGSTVNVEGIFSCYKGAWQIMPLSAEKVTSGVVEGDVVIEAPEHKGTIDDPYSVEDLEKLQAAQEALDNSKNKQYDGQKVAQAVKAVEAEIKNSGLNSRITEKKELELLAVSGDVTISYSIRESKSVTVEGTKLTINPGKPETTILQVNYKIGEFETVQLFYIKTLEPSAKSMLDELVVPEQLLKETALPTVEGATIEWTVGELNAEALTIDKENNKFVPHADTELNKAVIVEAKLSYNGETASKNFVITVLQEIILEHKGTKEDPYSISDVLKLIKIGDQVTSSFYVKGYVVEIGDWNSSYNNYQDGYMADSALKSGESREDIDSAYVYIFAGINNGKLCVGDEVTVSAQKLSYYNGVWELYKATAIDRKPVAELGAKENPYSVSDIIALESHDSVEEAFVSAYIVELGSYSDTYGIYNYAYIADSMSAEDKLIVNFIKGNGEGVLTVGDQIVVSVDSIVYNKDAWELNGAQVVERTAAEVEEPKPDTNTYVKGIVVELGDWSDANGYAYILIADAENSELKVRIANFKGINDGKLELKDELVCIFENIEKNEEQLQLTGVKVVTVNGEEHDDSIVPDEPVNPTEEQVYIKTHDGKYLTGQEYTYTNTDKGTSKIELVVSSDKSEAVQLTKRINSDGSITFVTADGKYLYTNGTDVKFVAEEGEYTLFELETVEGGYYIKSVNAKYNNNAQYLETYNGYVTVFGLANAKDLSIFVYSFETVESGSQGGETGGDVDPEPSKGSIVLSQKGYYVTGKDKLYNETKHQLEISQNISDALVLTVRNNSDGTVTFVTAAGKYLLSDGTHVQLVDSEGENTLFVLESVENGYYIRCNTANYNGAAQYLRIKYSVCSVFSLNESELENYIFNLETVASGSQGGETGGDVDPTPEVPSIEPAQPEVGSAYVIGFVRDSKIYYVDGEMVSQFYFNTVESKDSAIKVYVESVEGGFHLYVSNDNGATKKYINITKSADGQHTNSVYEDSASSVWVWDDSLKTLKVSLNSQDYVLGTTKSKTFTSLGPVKADADANYIAQFVFVEKVEGGEEDDPYADLQGIYGTKDGEIVLVFDVEEKSFAYYTEGAYLDLEYGFSAKEGYYETDLSYENGVYSFIYRRGITVSFSFNADKSQITISDTALNLVNGTLYYNANGEFESSEEENPIITGDSATFSEAQQATYTGAFGNNPGAFTIVLSADKVNFACAYAGYISTDYTALVNDGLYQVILYQYEDGLPDYLNFSFNDDGSLSVMLYYFSNEYTATATKEGASGGEDDKPVTAEKGTQENPYTADEFWNAYADKSEGWVSENQVYLKGVISSVPTSNSHGYSFDFVCGVDGVSVQGYSVKLNDVASIICQNDEVVIYGYIIKYSATVLEVGYTSTIENSNPVLISRVAGESSISAEANENATITLSKEKGNNDEEFTFTVEAKNGAVIDAVYVNGQRVDAQEDGSYKGIISRNTIVSVAARIPVQGEVKAEVDLSTNFATYANSWSGYAEKSITSADLCVDNLSFTVNFSNVIKQSQTITNMPVVASKNTLQYVTISVSGMSIKSATFNLKEWSSSKKFKTLTVEYSIDGSTWVATDVGQVDGTLANVSTIGTSLSANNLPNGVVAVRLAICGNDSEKYQQIGINGFTIVAE